jgi:hypothetical protein
MISEYLRHTLYLSGLGDPVGSNATAGLALRVIGTHNPLRLKKVEIPTDEITDVSKDINVTNTPTLFSRSLLHDTTKIRLYK